MVLCVKITKKLDRVSQSFKKQVILKEFFKYLNASIICNILVKINQISYFYFKGTRSLVSVPQFSVFQPCETSEQIVCLTTRKDLKQSSRTSATPLYSSYDNQQNKGTNITR